MPKVVLFNQKGSQVGELELSEYVYGCPEHQQAIFDSLEMDLLEHCLFQKFKLKERKINLK